MASIVDDGAALVSKTELLVEELDLACLDIASESHHVFRKQETQIYERLAELQCKYLQFVETEVGARARVCARAAAWCTQTEPFQSLWVRFCVCSSRPASNPPPPTFTASMRTSARKWLGSSTACRPCSIPSPPTSGTDNGTLSSVGGMGNRALHFAVVMWIGVPPRCPCRAAH